jgi:PIN domain nuclease of toxin-antitoxin system
MKYLIDTHILLWWLSGHKKLSPKIQNLIEDPLNSIFVSTASLWEIIIKKIIGKLEFPDIEFSQLLVEQQFEELAISSKYLDELENLPLIHADPFDRIIIAQAKTENISIITADKKIMEYKVGIVKL